ncbi:MAG: HAMP domain-containing sensor histidine kinase [Sulfurimonas sp.]|nr:HAMP domain-containing sensor histidine kinase [Sulfurimonas sp.]
MQNKTHNEVEFLSRKILDLNKQLIESQSAKSRFLSLVANELNNPMTALLGLIPHLKPQDMEKEKIYNLVHEEALMLEFRIQNLVAAAQIESGEYDLSFATVNVATLVNEALEALKYIILNRNISVSVTNTINDNIVSDPQKLFLIIHNLISNASLFGDANTQIEIHLSDKNNRLQIEVKNQGSGPNVAFKPQVFTRFSSDTSGLHGLGLGLSVVRSICELLEGDIDFICQDNFVIFAVTLPLKTHATDTLACGSNEFLFDSFEDAIEL